MSLNFSKKTWADGANGGTPITAAELNRHEDAIAALAGYLPVYDVQNATDTVSHTPCLLHVKGTGQMIYFDGTNRVPANQFDAQLNGDSTNAPQTKAVNSAIQSVRDSLTPLPTSVQSGVFIGSSNENGICVISYQSPNGKAPDVIVATPGPWSSNDMKGLAITIWENGVNSAQMRLMNTRSGEFGTRWPARFSWVAIWN